MDEALSGSTSLIMEINRILTSLCFRKVYQEWKAMKEPNPESLAWNPYPHLYLSLWKVYKWLVFGLLLPSILFSD